MRKFNSKKHKGAKRGYKSFTHVEIGYENCEYLQIPLKYAIIFMSDDGKYIKDLMLDLSKSKNKIDKWAYDSLEQRLKRILYNSNDITSVRLVRVNKKDDLLWNAPIKSFTIKDYLEINPNGWGCDNLLQTTDFDEELDVLHYSWIVDEDIKIDYWISEDKCRIEIPKIYSNIVNKLDKELWIIEEV